MLITQQGTHMWDMSALIWILFHFRSSRIVQKEVLGIKKSLYPCTFLMFGNNHWILCQPWPGKYKLIPGQGDRSPICGNQWSSPQSSNKQMEEPQTAVLVVALPSVCWTTGQVINLYWPGQIWRNIQALLPHITIASHWATVYQFSIPYFLVVVNLNSKQLPLLRNSAKTESPKSHIKRW